MDTETQPRDSATWDGDRDDDRRPKRQWLRSLVIIVALVALNRAITLPYLIFGPGDAQPTSELIDVAKEKRFAPKGEILLTTVTLTEAHPTDIVWAWFRPGTEIEKTEETLQGLTTNEFLDLNKNLVESSKLAAVTVAMTKAGYPVTFAGDGAQVSEVQPGAPAEGKLRKSDVMVAVNGVRVTTAQEATDAIRKNPAATPVTIDVVAADGSKRTETVITGRREDGASFLGVLISTQNPRVNTPFEIGIKNTPFGGPSAGLAFTLSLIDNLTSGELTGGKSVAVTGTIEPDGTVGPVGGVEQKTYAVNDSKATLFLVPSPEFEEAKKTADSDVTVLPVDTLDQALEALRRHGGEPIGNVV